MFPNITTWLSLIPPTQDQLTTGLLIVELDMWHLRASFSILTEVRKLMTSACHRVRHPLCTDEILSSWGFAIPLPNRLTLIGSLMFTVLQLWRAKLKEKKILLNSPDYQRSPQSTGFVLPKRSGISFKKSTIAALGLIFWLPSHPAFAWQEDNPLAYRPLPTPPIQQFHHPTGLTRWFLFPLTVYSNTISRVDGERCPSFPNCSQYAKEAILRHGAIPGIWLAIDRLIHERTEIQREDRIRLQDGSLRVPDTLDANDFWFYKHNN